MESEEIRKKLEGIILSYLMYDDLKTYKNFKLQLNIRYNSKHVKEFEITEHSSSKRGTWMLRFSYDPINNTSSIEVKSDRPMYIAEPYETNFNYCSVSLAMCMIKNAGQIKMALKEILL